MTRFVIFLLLSLIASCQGLWFRSTPSVTTPVPIQANEAAKPFPTTPQLPSDAALVVTDTMVKEARSDILNVAKTGSIVDPLTATDSQVIRAVGPSKVGWKSRVLSIAGSAAGSTLRVARWFSYGFCFIAESLEYSTRMMEAYPTFSAIVAAPLVLGALAFHFGLLVTVAVVAIPPFLLGAINLNPLLLLTIPFYALSYLLWVVGKVTAPVFSAVARASEYVDALTERLEGVYGSANGKMEEEARIAVRDQMDILPEALNGAVQDVAAKSNASDDLKNRISDATERALAPGGVLRKGLAYLVNLAFRQEEKIAAVRPDSAAH